MLEYINSLGIPVGDIINWAIVIVVVILAWIVAKVIASFVGKTIAKANFIKNIFEKIGVELNMKYLGEIISKIVFILLVFTAFVAILKYLNIEIKIVNDILDVYLPRIISASIITIVALLLANITKTGILKLSESSSLDKALGDKEAGVKIGDSLAMIGYWTVIVFFLPQILEKLGQNELLKPITNIIDNITAYIPNLIGAVIIFAISYIVAKIVSQIITSVLASFGFNKVLEKIGLKNMHSKVNASELVGKIIFTYIVLLAGAEAASTIGFTNITAIVNNIIVFATNIFIGVVILGIGLYLANLAGVAISSASDSKILPAIAKTAIIVLTSFMGLQQMGIGGDIINQAFTLTLGSIAVAFALAVGLGAKDIAGKEIEELINKLKK